MIAWLKRYLLILVLFAFANPQHAQTPGTQRFTISNGNVVKISRLYKNNQGYIFAGTSKGLYKFDGLKFTLIPFKNPPANPTVTAILPISAA